MIDAGVAWLAQNALQVGVTILILISYAAVDRYSTPKLEESIQDGGFKEDSLGRAKIMARILAGFVGVLLLLLIWGVDIGSLMVFAGTALTLLGVAMFASWSLLSNITCYFVLLVHPSYRHGTFIRVMDADNYAEGYIAEMTLFSVRLITENRETILYPNNLLLVRPTLIDPKDRLDGIGKLKPKEILVTPDQVNQVEAKP